MPILQSGGEHARELSVGVDEDTELVGFNLDHVQPAVAVYVGQSHISGALAQAYRGGHVGEARPLIVVVDAKAGRRDQNQVLPAVLVEVAHAGFGPWLEARLPLETVRRGVAQRAS